MVPLDRDRALVRVYRLSIAVCMVWLQFATQVDLEALREVYVKSEVM